MVSKDFLLLIKSVKSKKELATLDDGFVEERILKIFASNNTIKKKFDASKDFARFSRSREYEELLKRVRKELRAVYGMFQKSGEGARDELLKRLSLTDSENEKKDILTELLASHQSTRERVSHYDEIYTRICAIIKPTSVVDLGCGMNPLAHHYFVQHGFKPSIVASDLSSNDMRFLEECFAALKISGKTVALDLTKEDDIAKLPALTRGADVTFLFKLLDSLEETKRHVSYKLFDHIKSDWIVASFPTKSLGGKKTIARAGRSWFERLLGRKGLKWETFSVENELFYVIRVKR